MPNIRSDRPDLHERHDKRSEIPLSVCMNNPVALRRYDYAPLMRVVLAWTDRRVTQARVV